MLRHLLRTGYGSGTLVIEHVMYVHFIEYRRWSNVFESQSKFWRIVGLYEY